MVAVWPQKRGPIGSRFGIWLTAYYSGQFSELYSHKIWSFGNQKWEFETGKYVLCRNQFLSLGSIVLLYPNTLTVTLLIPSLKNLLKQPNLPRILRTSIDRFEIKKSNLIVSKSKLGQVLSWLVTICKSVFQTLWTYLVGEWYVFCIEGTGI
jgi:hypothetical protein